MEQNSKFDKVMGSWDILVIAFGAMIGWGWVINSGDWITTSEFVERFPELSLFYRLFSPSDSEMICIFPYFCPYAESARE